jgi:hypothetical protein
VGHKAVVIYVYIQMKTRSQVRQLFTVKETEAAKALLELKRACGVTDAPVALSRPKRACTQKPEEHVAVSQRPRRSTANY